MIRNNYPLSIAETKEYLKKSSDSDADFSGFVLNFTKLGFKEAKELRKNLQDLGIMKLRDENIIKIIDVMPENSESLNKIFTDVSLDEDETKKILETVKQFK